MMGVLKYSVSQDFPGRTPRLRSPNIRLLDALLPYVGKGPFHWRTIPHIFDIADEFRGDHEVFRTELYVAHVTIERAPCG